MLHSFIYRYTACFPYSLLTTIKSNLPLATEATKSFKNYLAENQNSYICLKLQILTTVTSKFSQAFTKRTNGRSVGPSNNVIIFLPGPYYNVTPPPHVIFSFHLLLYCPSHLILFFSDMFT